MPHSNEKRERFKRVASRRVQSIIDGLSSLSNCANTNNYEYSEEEVFKMFKAIKEELRNTETVFKTNIDKNKKEFKF